MGSALTDDGASDRPRTTATVDVYSYDPVRGTGTWWDQGAEVRAEVFDLPGPTVVISGNRAGLRSLARHLLTLAADEVPDGSTFSFDPYLGMFAPDSMAIRLEVEQEHDRLDGAAAVPGQFVHGRVVAHHPWGIDLVLEGTAGRVGTVDLRFLSDRADDLNEERFPAIGSRLRAKVQGLTPSGQLRLTTRAADLSAPEPGDPHATGDGS